MEEKRKRKLPIYLTFSEKNDLKILFPTCCTVESQIASYLRYIKLKYHPFVVSNKYHNF